MGTVQATKDALAIFKSGNEYIGKAVTYTGVNDAIPLRGILSSPEDTFKIFTFCARGHEIYKRQDEGGDNVWICDFADGSIVYWPDSQAICIKNHESDDLARFVFNTEF